MSPDQLSEEKIFDGALQLESDAARLEYLTRTCRDDDQIARIQALLKEGAPEASFLENGPAALQDSDDWSPDLPERLGDFEILGELGRGGMGVVYRARQCSLNRLVALKVLSAGLALTTRAIMRFKLEAEAAAKLHHTNIVPIYWTGEENRVPYYAMELVDGPSLDQVIRQLRREANSGTDVADLDGGDESQNHDAIAATLICSSSSTDGSGADTDSANFDSSSSLGSDSSYYDTLARMMAGVADAMAHAHDHGIVHRDIKPANLLLSSDGRLSVNDFGLARMLEQPGMTMTGEFMGSPMYMSPEQITAGRLPLDHRTDIYSLGATLYELLTLTPPFSGKQRDQVLTQVIHKDPPRPGSINRRIPKDLETICMKAMEKDPDRRYQTAELMAEDLRRFVNRHAITARRVGPLEKGIRWVRKNRAISAMACLMVLLCLGMGWFLHSKQNEKHRHDEMSLAQIDVMNLDLAGAEKHVAEAIDYGADRIETDLIEYQIFLLQGRNQEALKILEPIAEQPAYRSDVRIHSLLAYGYAMNGNWSAYTIKSTYLLTLTPKTGEEFFQRGRALSFFDPGCAKEDFDSAAKDKSGHAEFWVARAAVLIFLSLMESGGNPNHVDTAEGYLRNASDICGEETFVITQYRLYARLTRAHFLRMRGEEAAALKVLEDGKPDVDKLAQKPQFLFGNFMRLYYYDLLDDFDGLKKVMEDVVDNQHSGWLTDPYFARCFRDGEFDAALDMLERLSQQDEYVIIRTAAFRLHKADSEKTIDQNTIDEIHREAHRSFNRLPRATQFAGMLSFGKHEETKAYWRHLIATEGDKLPPQALAKGQLLIGDVTAEELLKHSRDSEMGRAETNYTIGMKSLAEGNRKVARKYLAEASSGTMYHWSTYLTAREYAAKLDPSNPRYEEGWPSWCPPEADEATGELPEKPE